MLISLVVHQIKSHQAHEKIENRKAKVREKSRMFQK